METAPRHRRRKQGRILWGVLLITAGAVMMVERLGLMDVRVTTHLWPVVPLALGVLRLIDPCTGRDGRPAGRRPAAWLLFVGGWGLLNEFHVFGLAYWNSWPLFIIFVGINMVWRSTEVSAPGTHGERRTG
jgi:hypothetical protein